MWHTYNFFQVQKIRNTWKLFSVHHTAAHWAKIFQMWQDLDMIWYETRNKSILTFFFGKCPILTIETPLLFWNHYYYFCSLRKLKDSMKWKNYVLGRFSMDLTFTRRSPEIASRTSQNRIIWFCQITTVCLLIVVCSRICLKENDVRCHFLFFVLFNGTLEFSSLPSSSISFIRNGYECHL